jgi:hypothetical protein
MNDDRARWFSGCQKLRYFSSGSHVEATAMRTRLHFQIVVKSDQNRFIQVPGAIVLHRAGGVKKNRVKLIKAILKTALHRCSAARVVFEDDDFFDHETGLLEASVFLTPV